MRAKTFFPPIARLARAAVVALSIPPDKPRTIPLAPAFSTYSLIKRQILVCVSEKLMSKTEGVSFNRLHQPLYSWFVGKYLRTSINITQQYLDLKAVVIWVEEERKLFIFQRNVYQNSFPAPNAGKKLLRLTFPGRKAVMLLLNAVAVG